jgi:hypothetical protein
MSQSYRIEQFKKIRKRKGKTVTWQASKVVTALHRRGQASKAIEKLVERQRRLCSALTKMKKGSEAGRGAEQARHARRQRDNPHPILLVDSRLFVTSSSRLSAWRRERALAGFAGAGAEQTTERTLRGHRTDRCGRFSMRVSRCMQMHAQRAGGPSSAQPFCGKKGKKGKLASAPSLVPYTICLMNASRANQRKRSRPVSGP